MDRDALEVIDNDLPAIVAGLAAELSARLAAGERLASHRDGVAVAEYIDSAGNLIVEPLARTSAPVTLAAAE